MNRKQKAKLLKAIATGKKKISELEPVKIIIRRRVIKRNENGELVETSVYDRTIIVENPYRE